MTGWTPPRNIIEAAQRRAHRLRGYASLAKLLKKHLDDATDKARELIVKPLPRPIPGLAHGAEDGGSDTIEFEHFTLYGIQAWAASFRLEGDTLRTAAEIRAADVGIVFPSGSDEIRVRFYRETLEAWAAARAVEAAPGGVFFWDGSITPLLAGRRPWSERGGRARELARRAAESLGVEPEELPLIVAAQHEEEPLSILELVERREALKKMEYGWVSYLEWLEKLEAVRRFLQAAMRNGTTVVFVTKTSRSRSLLEAALPDVYFLAQAEADGDPFYTVPRLRCGALDVKAFEDENAAWRLLPEGYREYFSSEIAVLDLYARLARGGNIIRLEAALPAGEACPHQGDDAWAREAALEILGMIAGVPMRRGYPYPLLVAHREASIRRDELARAARILGLGAARRGREMLS